jgi:hypothetical protein
MTTVPAGPEDARDHRAYRRSVTGKVIGMGCLLVLLAAFAPRVALGLVWIFTDLVDRAFDNFLVPLLGLVFLPFTTLFYVLAWSPVVGVDGWEWAFVALGFLFDLGHWVGGAASRR